MNIREISEEKEYKILSPYAAHSRDTKGRAREEKSCDIRTVFQRDRDRILHSKSFRRLKDKTQVFLAPQGDHYRTRLTHTLEVSQISRTIARALSLNEDLTEAIALGHDLGHTPFGHEGEEVLNDLSECGFKHAEQSLRVVDVLENEGQGLNLTWEVRDGILNHRTSGAPATLEGAVVRLSDKIAYIHHDMDDAARAGVISEDDIPVTLRVTLGATCKERLDTMVKDVIENSFGKGSICQSEKISEAMMALRKIMFANVYSRGVAKQENAKVKRMLSALYEYYTENPMKMSKEYVLLLEKGTAKSRAVCDYISGMTDQYAIHIFNELFEPRGWSVY
ncbi:MAG TPA: deoxyguanosinetriphosphate triphosphohydrolase [Candidatus Alectryocaccobium stercorigallinarum]|nr:deoxyguanosinetriphosphate triphosphohydrolase [Candidatus Alectryocaccobium stercorigallinarum]